MSFFGSPMGNMLQMYAQQRFPQFQGQPGLQSSGTPTGYQGLHNALFGSGQGAFGTPYANMGALLGGDPKSSWRMNMPSTKSGSPAGMQQVSPSAQTQPPGTPSVLPGGPEKSGMPAMPNQNPVMRDNGVQAPPNNQHTNPTAVQPQQPGKTTGPVMQQVDGTPLPTPGVNGSPAGMRQVQPMQQPPGLGNYGGFGLAAQNGLLAMLMQHGGGPRG